MKMRTEKRWADAGLSWAETGPRNDSFQEVITMQYFEIRRQSCVQQHQMTHGSALVMNKARMQTRK